MENNGEDNSKQKGIYFLKKNNKIIYIGIAGVRKNQKGTLGKRLHNHYPKSKRDKNKVNFLSNADALIYNISISKILPKLLKPNTNPEFDKIREQVKSLGVNKLKIKSCIYGLLNSGANYRGCKKEKKGVEKKLKKLNKKDQKMRKILKEILNKRLLTFFSNVYVEWFCVARNKNLIDLERFFILIFNPEYNK